MADDLPQEVAIDILARLPIREIVKCRSVCKTWHSLISTTAFQSYHLNNNNTGQKLILFRHDVDEIERTELYRLCIDDADFPGTVIHEFQSPFTAANRYLRILGCCNGVICFEDDLEKRVALWNPCIRKLVEIPPPILDHKPYSGAVGYGYDAVNDDYKLVRISVDAVKGQLLIREGSCAVHMDGVCYWLASRRKPGQNNMIVSFALGADQVFDEIAVPDDVVESYQLQLASNLFCNRSDDKLLSLVHHWYSSNLDGVTIWVMKEGSWMKVVRWELSHYVYKIVALKENEVALFIAASGLFDTTEGLVRYDSGKGEGVEVMVARDVGILAFFVNYVQSLALLV
ncbi:F-box/kelch-repeat protein At3g23880 [Linum grandiflorum]